MGSEWIKVALQDVCAPPQYGAIAKGGNEHCGPLFIRQTDISTGRVDWNSVPRCDLAAADVPKYAVQKGDILISRLGAGVGQTALVNEPNGAVFAGYLVRFQPNPKVAEPQFVGYHLRSQAWFDHVYGYSSGAAQPTLNAKQMGAFEFELPPLPEQRAIAHILGSLDDKIELNRKTNETLEAMARALFKSWFIDFDPVRAKAEGRTPVGMNAETAALFPSEFEDSELGEIPKGWSWRELGEVATLNPPRSLRKGTLAPYVEMSSLPTTGGRPSGWPLREFGSGVKFRNGDTLLARITPCLENGKTGFVDFLADEEIGWGSTEYIVIRPSDPLPEEWAYLLAREEAFRDFAQQKMEGSSGRQRVPAAAISRYQVVMPSNRVALAFGGFIQPLFQRISALGYESSSLQELRDLLLPKLLSGELSISDAAER